ncbi:unnamed protein product [Urochloa humidicola]
MALRSLLRRVPGAALLSPPGPRMGPGLGISPSAASRFVATRSEGDARTAAELQKEIENLTKLQESIEVRRQHSIDLENKMYKEVVELQKSAGQSLDEYKRAIDNLRKVGDVACAVIVAIPVLLIFGSKYEA